ncbi:hypothetical protein C8J55DRAFT_554563 [Lentinula edodes]|uniref:Uncharacterized protein n=1 Tax=Lentinula lateritia TaxID=40482 RepID=A0A9W9B1W9_9AGAR|nr:hypothetical protein C8J55DRAFT_554563 [Lentinula edodes]
MKAVLFASAVALISGAYAQDFTINTPGSLTECEPVLLQWTGGTPPYFLRYMLQSLPAVYNSGAPSTNAETLTTTNSTSFTWTVNIASGQSIGFNIVDNTGAEKQSAAVPIQAGSSTSCVGQSVSGSAGATTTAATTGSGSASTTGSGSSSTTAKSTGSSSGSSSSTSAAGSSTTSSSSNGASSQAAQLGAAGFIGAAIAALLA